MQVLEKLSARPNKTEIKKVVDFVGDDANRFNELLNHFLSDDMRVSQAASWAMSDAGVNQPQLLTPHHRVLINSLKEKQKHNALRRNIVRIYQTVEIPDEYEAELYDICLNFISNTDEAIAVRAFSIRVCERVIERYPELANELLEIIKANMSIWSSGLRNRGNKFLKKWG